MGKDAPNVRCFCLENSIHINCNIYIQKKRPSNPNGSELYRKHYFLDPAWGKCKAKMVFCMQAALGS